MCVLNRPSSTTDEAIRHLPIGGHEPRLGHIPLRGRGRQGDQANVYWRAPGSDGIPAELFKSGGPSLLHRLTVVLLSSSTRERHEAIV